MRKLFTILSICMFTANYCFAAGMELSDLIETARETEVQQTVQEQPVSDVTKEQTPTVNTEEAMTPVKNETKSLLMEETQAVEKVSPDTTTMDTKTLKQPITTTTLDNKPAQSVESKSKMKQINNETVSSTTNNATKTLGQSIPTTKVENEMAQPDETILPQEKTMDSTTEMTEPKKSTGMTGTSKTNKIKKTKN